MRTVRRKSMCNECRRGRICPIEDDEHPPRGRAEDEARNAAELESSDLRQHIQTVVRVGTVDIENTTDDFNLMRETRVGDIRAASRDLLGGQPKE